MSDTLRRVLELIEHSDVRVSAHGYDELAQDGILVQDAISGAEAAVVVEEYPEYHKGPCVLALQHDSKRRPFHVLWGNPQERCDASRSGDSVSAGPGAVVQRFQEEKGRRHARLRSWCTKGDSSRR